MLPLDPNRQRIGVVCIDPRIDHPTSLAFPVLYDAVGKNTGNFMFTQAMFSLLEGDVRKVGFAFDPAQVNREFDIVVVPAANWLNKSADWDWLTERLQELTVPVVVFGLGLQADTMNIEDVSVSDSALRLARFLASSAPAISVRGDLTRTWLASQGIENVVTTGCPSLYMNIFDTSEDTPASDIVFQSTRYGVTRGLISSPGINRFLFSCCARFGMPMVYQSETEEMELLTYDRKVSELDAERQELLAALYGAADAEEFETYLRRHGRVFFNLPDWSEFVRRHMGVIGTRLHGSIIALNSGRRAVLVPHDSRTAEVAKFSGIPTVNGPDIVRMTELDEIRDVVAGVSMERYKDIRARNQGTFLRFLSDCGLRPDVRNIF